jgi:penicillin amidase
MLWQSMKKRLRKILSITICVLLGPVAILVISAIFMLRGSLPRLNGEKTLPDLKEQVEVLRDDLGVPDIKAATRIDAARALGYIHAQDRFFQMDLQRRSAAGELAALLGPQLVSTDRSVRIHRFRDLADRVFADAPPRYKVILEAYSEGVNEGLADLGTRPFEYLVLRKKPEPWKPEDTVLTISAMFLDLSLSIAFTEHAYSMVADVLPESLANYLLTPAARWDAPLQKGPPFSATIPDSTEGDLRRWKVGSQPGKASETERTKIRSGSNNWAVAGSLSAHGGALLANDMHLSHGIPNIWYKARMSWKEGSKERSVVGITLPGTPALIVGSNGYVAWGFTNSFLDSADLVRLELDPADSTRYKTPEGWKHLEIASEVIEIAGSAPDTFLFRQTIWGPVWNNDVAGNPLALRWTAHDTDAVNLALIKMEDARNVDDAVLAAAGSGIPPQNFVCADIEGDIAWSIAGRIPKRFGWDGRIPVSWADGTCGWDGYIAPAHQPKISRPEEGRLWTANNRVVGGYFYSILGDGGYGLGARAQQIRDGLRTLDRPDEEDMLALQLDDRALLLEEWRQLAIEAVAGDTTASRAEFARLLREDWTGRASVESAGYRLTRAFTYSLIDIVYRSLTGPIRMKTDDFKSYRLPYRHSITWQLVQRRPPHLLMPPDHNSWDDVLMEAIDKAMELATAGGRPAEKWTWGDRNIVDISHPFVFLLPQLRRWLAAPLVSLPGDSHMPRFQSPRAGASERMVVSPGREEEGILHMPGGQSGHPLSEFFLAGHEDWAYGKPSSLLPAKAAYRLVLKPVK